MSKKNKLNHLIFHKFKKGVGGLNIMSKITAKRIKEGVGELKMICEVLSREK